MRRNARSAKRQTVYSSLEVEDGSQNDGVDIPSPLKSRRRRRPRSILQVLQRNPKSALVLYVGAALILSAILIITLACHIIFPDASTPSAPESGTTAIPPREEQETRRNEKEKVYEERPRQETLHAEPLPIFQIIMPASPASEAVFHHPPEVSFPETDLVPDFDNLQFQYIVEPGVPRTIYYDFHEDITDFRGPDRSRDDDMEMYYAFDDDLQRSEYTANYLGRKTVGEKTCRRTADHKLNFQTCNIIHETSLIENGIRYLASGAFRQVMRVDRKYLGTQETIIFKDIRNDFDIEYDHFEYTRMDGIVAERLTRHPAIFDIYGMCGLCIASEFFPHGDMDSYTVPTSGMAKQEDLDKEPELRPRNNLTAIEKLSIATQMAESLALLHNYEHGVIVHDDVQPAQFLFNADKSILKLNDFNRAEWMLWDDENQEYCKYNNGHAGAAWRAPEEYKDAPLNEKIDVFSLGNNLYSILTGLWPFYTTDDDGRTQQRLMKGETAFIDSRYYDRSPAEATIVDVIEQCWTYDPDERPSMTRIGQILRKKLDELEAK